MLNTIVHSSDPVTLVGGGSAVPADLREALSLAPLCVAADGGAALALEAGIDPLAVIGDFDSLPADLLARIPRDRQHRIAEQMSTDFEKALTRIDAPLVIGVGFAGGRVDHQLAALHTLFALPHRPCVLLAGAELIFLAPPAIDLPTARGDVVSLFPLAAVTGHSTGLEWPIDGLTFAPETFVGTSNRATGPVHLQMDGPGMLMIVPRRLIRPVTAQLSRPDLARWPARAG